MSPDISKRKNPLGIEPVGALLRRFAVPSIVAMLVSSLYNIVDQFFIGRGVGPLGNAATSICFPLTISCISIALLLGIGGASAFNLDMGAGNEDTAGYFIGNAASVMLIGGVILAAVSLLFTRPLLLFFGSPDDVLPYAMTYLRVCAFGFPALILSAGGAHLIRADGSPNITMLINLSGAIVNTVLDRHRPPRREAAPVAHALHLVDERDRGIARQQEIGVHRMSRQDSRSSAGPDHVTLQALITWLIKSRSRD